MLGERVGHTYAGPTAGKMVHFLDAVARDRPVLVTVEQARKVMECWSKVRLRGIGLCSSCFLSRNVGRKTRFPLFLTLLCIAADLSAERNEPVTLPLNTTPTLKAMAG